MGVRILSTTPEFDEMFARSKVTEMGPVTEVMTFDRKPNGPQCYRLSANTYCDMKTGEIRECKHSESRADNLSSVRRTLARVRALINTNVTIPENCRWVTLTYRENMTDRVRLYKDYKKFWQSFCRWCVGEGYGRPEYISVAEPQGRGAWHIHAFFIWSGPAPFIPNNGVLEHLWSHGFTKVKAIRASWDNPGAYFTAYLADIPANEVDKLPEDIKGRLKEIEIEMEDDSGIKLKKKFIKGGRLCMYPPGFNILRHSRGIKEPEIEWMSIREAKEKVSSAKLTFSRSFEIVDDDGGRIRCTLSKEYYNSRRK